MTIDTLIRKLNDAPASVTLDEALATIAEAYEVTPCGYSLGGTRFEVDRAFRSCQLYAFGLLNRLTPEQTLSCFGHHYQEDVLKHPQGTDHETIRTFMKHGWAGLKLDAMPLAPKG